MKEFKKAAVIIACVVLLCGQTARAISVPMLPYIPPTDAQLWDMIFNAFGVTAPDIEDAEKKLEAYWTLYQTTMGAAYDEFEEDMREVFDGAKTNRKALIIPTVREGLVKGMKKALQDGMTYVSGGTVINDYAGYLPALRQLGINKITAQELSENAERNGVASNIVGNVWVYTVNQYGLVYNVFVLPKTATVNIVTEGNARKLVFTGINTVPVIAWRYLVDADTVRPNFEFSNPTQNIPSNTTVQKIGGETVQTVNVSAKNQAVSNSIFGEIASIITASTKLVNGQIDDTKPIEMRIPITLPLPATDVSELDEAEAALNTVPSADTADVAETVAELQEVEAARYGDTEQYSVDLTTYFPFCIPFDIARIVEALKAEPEAPHFVFPLPSDVEDGKVVFSEYEFSLDWMSPVMVWVRRGELILGGIGIMLMTRNIIRG